MVLVDGPMRREVAIRWTNRKRAGAVWACATQIKQCTEFADASDEDMSDDVTGSRNQSQINPLFKTNILRGEPFL